ncbi:MAG: large conductance mechanosensitive channel protein MscL, partial [Bacteroidota bacterium]
VGIIIGAAFGTIVTALVDGILMPPIGLLLGDVDFANIFTVLQEGDPAGPYATLEAAQEAGAVVMAWGALINTVISFLIVAFAVFIFVKWINRAKEAAAADAVEEPEAEPTMTADQELLAEIRDLLKQRPV